MKSLLLQKDQLKFNLFCPFEKSFQITEEQPEMPEKFASLQLDPGYYVWGYASVQGVDLQGDVFPIETLKQMAPGLTQPPYNKIFLFHNYEDIASGTIIATAMDDKGLLILAKLNEEHSRAQEVWGSVQNQSLDGFSMGGSFLRVDTIEDEESGMTFNVVREAIATEVSLTSAPVNGESIILGAFKKSKDIFYKAEDKNFNKSLKIEMKGEDKKFFINQEFMKSIDSQKEEKYIKNQKLKKGMVEVKDLNSKQKEVFDKAVSEGKNKDEAMKLASALLDKEAVEGVKTKNEELAENPEKTGAENEKTKKKELKKSLDDEKESSSEEETETSEANDEEGDNAESSEDVTKKENEETGKEESEKTDEEKVEEAEKKKVEESAEEEKENESEETEEKEEETIEQKYEKALKTIEQLESELAPFKKAMPGKKNDSPEKKPLRKSIKTKQDSSVKAVNGTESPKLKTPFLDWVKKV